MNLVTAGIARRQWSYSFRCGAHSKTALTIGPCTFGAVPTVTVKGRRAGVSMPAMVLIVTADYAYNGRLRLAYVPGAD